MAKTSKAEPGAKPISVIPQASAVLIAIAVRTWVWSSLAMLCRMQYRPFSNSQLANNFALLLSPGSCVVAQRIAPIYTTSSNEWAALWPQAGPAQFKFMIITDPFLVEWPLLAAR